MSRRLVLVTSHFPPSNSVNVHRARLWSRYLPEFGWEPTVVTSKSRQYEERLDPDLERLVAPGLEVVQSATLPVRPVRLVGDIGMRAFWGCYRTVADLVRQRRADFVLVTIPSNFLAPLGRLMHGRFGVPFGLDYQDPWVAWWSGVDRKFSRAWWSYKLATWLEPWSVHDAALITGMAPGYLAGMLERNPDVAKRAIVATMPMGSAPEDYEPGAGDASCAVPVRSRRRPLPHDLRRRPAAGRHRRARSLPCRPTGAPRAFAGLASLLRVISSVRAPRRTIRTDTRSCRGSAPSVSRRWSTNIRIASAMSIRSIISTVQRGSGAGLD